MESELESVAESGNASSKCSLRAANVDPTPPYCDGKPTEEDEEEESCLLADSDMSTPFYSMPQPSTSHLDLTDATISQEMHAPTGALL